MKQVRTDRSSSVLWPLMLALALTVPAVGWAQSDPGSTDDWEIGARALPFPAAASDPLRAAIAAAPAPDVTGRKAMPELSDDQIRAMQGATSTNLEVLQKQAGVKIERKEVEGIGIYSVIPEKIAPEHANHLFLHVHGGGYVLGGGDDAVSEAAQFAGAIGVRAISVDYRMPPDHPFPAAVDDAVTIYKHVIQHHAPGTVFIGGTSAGGGLSLTTVLKLKELGLELPGAIWVGTPWADLTKTSDSLYTNEGIDRVLVTYEGLIAQMAKLYADGEDLKHPLISPLYGDFSGFPPTQLVTGTRDMFLSDTARTHRKLRAAGVEADLNVYEALSHAEYLMVPGAPEGEQVAKDLSAFLQRHLD